MPTHEDTDSQYHPQDGSGEPHPKGRRVTGTLPTYSHPNHVEIPMAAATQAQTIRPSVPPNKNEDEIDDGWCEEAE